MVLFSAITGDNRSRQKTEYSLPTPSRRAASVGLFPSRINCKSVSSLIFFFAMDTSWKHHGNFWFTAVIARLILKMSYRQSAEKPGGEFERLQLNATNIFHSTTRAGKRAREVGPAVRGRRAKAEQSGLPSHLAEPLPMPLILFYAMETYGNTLETSWKNMETFERLFPFAFARHRGHREIGY